MIVKERKKDKETGKIKYTFTSNKPGYKIVMVGGKPQERKMSKEELANRDHGKETNGKGAEGSKMKQKGISKPNIVAAKERREMNEANEIVTLKNKLDELKTKLKKAKLDYAEAKLTSREDEILKKEKYFKSLEKLVDQDREKMKKRQSFFVKDDEKKKEKKDIVKKIDAMVKDIEKKNTEKGRENIKDCPKEKNKPKDLNEDITNKLKKMEVIMQKYHKRAYDADSELKNKQEDILDRMYKKLQEAEPEDEEDPKKDVSDAEAALGGDEEGGEEDLSGAEPEGEEADLGGEEAEGGEEGGEEAEGGEDLEVGDIETDDEDPNEEDDANLNADDEEEKADSVTNEIKMIVNREEFDVGTNNAYDFYDFIVDKLFSANAKKALNLEYAKIEKAKRKVTPAKQLYDQVVKMLDVLDKKQADKYEMDLGGGEEEGASEEDPLA